MHSDDAVGDRLCEPAGNRGSPFLHLRGASPEPLEQLVLIHAMASLLQGPEARTAVAFDASGA
ncbi:MAG: hypothetical protein HYR63_04970 [Proteobacteria bacterium]|nr:hypothetical protein [Pseudomonadota bacterium]